MVYTMVRPFGQNPAALCIKAQKLRRKKHEQKHSQNQREQKV